MNEEKLIRTGKLARLNTDMADITAMMKSDMRRIRQILAIADVEVIARIDIPELFTCAQRLESAFRQYKTIRTQIETLKEEY